MRRPNRPLIALAIAAALAITALAAPKAYADYIFLDNVKDGDIYRGTTEDADDDDRTIIYLSTGGSFTIEKSRVVAIESEMSLNERVLAGNAALREKDNEAAVRHFRIVAIEKPRSQLALLGLSKAFMAMNELETAETHANLGVLLYHSDAQLRLQYGEVLSLLGKFDEATKQFAAAVENDPNNQVVRDLARAAGERNRERRNNPQNPGVAGNDLQFDPMLGVNRDTAELADRMLAWARETDVDAFPTGRLTAVADAAANQALERAIRTGNATTYKLAVEEYRKVVQKADFEVTVKQENWEAMSERTREITIVGWHFQIKQRYPNALIGISVKAQLSDRNYKTMATAVYDANRKRVMVTHNPPE